MSGGADPPWLNAALPQLPWAQRLPGVGPMQGEWLRVSDSFAAQMIEKERLLHGGADVVAQQPAAEDAARELLETVLEDLGRRDDFTQQRGIITRPDGVAVRPDPTQPMRSLVQLCQEDFCLLQKTPDQNEYHLTAAALCFPASWRLRDKIGQPLTAIHDPVTRYAPEVARRVGRLFDGVQTGQPLERANALLYADPSLHLPHPKQQAGGPFLRCERQVIRRLPFSGAVVFSIHTYMVHRHRLTPQTEARLSDYLKDHAPQ